LQIFNDVNVLATQYAIVKEIKTNSSSTAVKKCVASKKAIVKKKWNPDWQPRNGCDYRLKAKL